MRPEKPLNRKSISIGRRASEEEEQGGGGGGGC